MIFKGRCDFRRIIKNEIKEIVSELNFQKGKDSKYRHGKAQSIPLARGEDMYRERQTRKLGSQLSNRF